MEFLYSNKESDLNRRFFDFFLSSVSQNDFNSIGICGGRNIVPLLTVFDENNYSLKKSHFFLVDERCVDLGSNESNFKLLSEGFFSKMIDKNLIHSSNLHPFIYNEFDEASSVHNYNIEFNSRFTRLDISILSVGEDGHIASLFPSRGLLFSEMEGYQYEYDAPKFPSKRISLTPKSLRLSKSCVLLFMGEEKRGALENFLNSKVSLKECPAKILEGSSRLLVLTNVEGVYAGP
ncbi:6-phosphogluconolactonase [Borrelia sp. BU AG58]|uniref:6-phosphogluconolactonase n=1 Tax=Borrelia sp. BU AG58 TaxID=2887345 RepID=UPI001E4EB2CE|nr:6-phosphogluconolactonase [Borrelia sp. BU AG58]UER68008.1 6-phosphogluconolactonase [Borrelia sp. BU AG58]